MTFRIFLAATAGCFLALSPVYAQQADRPDALLWQSLRDSADALAFETFLDVFPDSEYAPRARERLAALDGARGSDNRPAIQDGLTASQTTAPDACDLLTAHPFDSDRRFEEGVDFADLEADPQPAIEACLALVDSDSTGRIAYQLSRAYIAAGDDQNRRIWVETAAQQGWARAKFRLGLVLIDDENTSDARLHDAVDMLEDVGDDYPFGYVDAGHTLWERLEGPEVHRDRIVDLFDRAAALGQDDAYMQLARLVSEGHVNGSPFEMINLLSQMMQDDHKTGWAKDHIAPRILQFLEMYRDGNFAGFGQIDAAWRSGFGEDGVISEVEINTLVDWTLDTILTSENVDRFSYEARYNVAKRLMSSYARTFPSPVLKRGMTMMQAADVSLDTDPQMAAILDMFCAITAVGTTPEMNTKALNACANFRAAFDESVYGNLMQGHLSNLALRDSRTEVAAFLQETQGSGLDYSLCLTSRNIRTEGERILIDVQNICPAPVTALATFSVPNGSTSARPRLEQVIPAGAEQTMAGYVNAGGDYPLSQFTNADIWGCHDAYERPLSEQQIFSCRSDNMQMDALTNFSSSLGATLAHDDYVRELQAIFNGGNARDADTRFSIPEDRCALIVAARQTEEEARAYIAHFKDTNDWFWKVYESENGWFAISADLVLIAEADYALRTLKAQQAIPQDAYCSGPGAFVRRVI